MHGTWSGPGGLVRTGGRAGIAASRVPSGADGPLSARWRSGVREALAQRAGDLAQRDPGAARRRHVEEPVQEVVALGRDGDARGAQARGVVLALVAQDVGLAGGDVGG